MPTKLYCPRCRVEVASRYSKAGKIFYICANYPECLYTWGVEDHERLGPLDEFELDDIDNIKIRIANALHDVRVDRSGPNQNQSKNNLAGEPINIEQRLKALETEMDQLRKTLLDIQGRKRKIGFDLG